MSSWCTMGFGSFMEKQLLQKQAIHHSFFSNCAKPSYKMQYPLLISIHLFTKHVLRASEGPREMLARLEAER